MNRVTKSQSFCVPASSGLAPLFINIILNLSLSANLLILFTSFAGNRIDKYTRRKNESRLLDLALIVGLGYLFISPIWESNRIYHLPESGPVAIGNA